MTGQSPTLRPLARPRPAEPDLQAVTASYDEDFFDAHHAGALRSAQTIVPLVMKLIRPRSVVDVGCGAGTWLAVFQEHGVADLIGIDGARLAPERVKISPRQLLSMDLRAPIRLARKFDLVVSLEVAEHLPPEHADRFVESLTRLGPAILFSAAVPAQGGTQHLNEQWPDYWAGRFERLGYTALDAIRPVVWHDAMVEVWYAQNALLFVRERQLARYPALRHAVRATHRLQLAVVHPRLFTAVAEQRATALEDCAAAEKFAEQQRADAEAHRGTAEFHIGEATRYRGEAESQRATTAQAVAEAVRRREEADGQLVTAAAALARAECHRSEADALRAKVEVYVADLEHARVEAEAERRKVDLYIAAVTRSREEAASQKVAAEYYLAEAGRYRTEATAQREEAAQARTEAAAERAGGEQLRVLYESMRAELDGCRAELARYHAERGISLRRLLRLVPAAVRGALQRRKRRLLARA